MNSTAAREVLQVAKALLLLAFVPVSVVALLFLVVVSLQAISEAHLTGGLLSFNDYPTGLRHFIVGTSLVSLSVGFAIPLLPLPSQLRFALACGWCIALVVAFFLGSGGALTVIPFWFGAMLAGVALAQPMLLFRRIRRNVRAS